MWVVASKELTYYNSEKSPWPTTAWLRVKKRRPRNVADGHDTCSADIQFPNVWARRVASRDPIEWERAVLADSVDSQMQHAADRLPCQDHSVDQIIQFNFGFRSNFNT